MSGGRQPRPSFKQASEMHLTEIQRMLSAVEEKLGVAEQGKKDAKHQFKKLAKVTSAHIDRLQAQRHQLVGENEELQTKLDMERQKSKLLSQKNADKKARLGESEFRVMQLEEALDEAATNCISSSEFEDKLENVQLKHERIVSQLRQRNKQLEDRRLEVLNKYERAKAANKEYEQALSQVSQQKEALRVDLEQSMQDYATLRENQREKVKTDQIQIVWSTQELAAATEKIKKDKQRFQAQEKKHERMARQLSERNARLERELKERTQLVERLQREKQSQLLWLQDEREKRVALETRQFNDRMSVAMGQTDLNLSQS
jgi:hypothetical protein